AYIRSQVKCDLAILRISGDRYRSVPRHCRPNPMKAARGLARGIITVEVCQFGLVARKAERREVEIFEFQIGPRPYIKIRFGGELREAHAEIHCRSAARAEYPQSDIL